MAIVPRRYCAIFCRRPAGSASMTLRLSAAPAGCMVNHLCGRRLVMRCCFSSSLSKRFSWALVILFIHTQSVMGVSMRTGASSPIHAGMQTSVTGDAGTGMIHSTKPDNNERAISTSCPTKSRMQDGSTFGCGGCAPCCSAVSVLDGPLLTPVRAESVAFAKSKPAGCAPLLPFHPPKRI